MQDRKPRDFFASDNEQQPVQAAPRDFFAPEIEPEETLGQSAMYALPRVGTDIAKSALNAFNSIPSYYHAAQTEIPGLGHELAMHPGNILGQGIAGVGELGQSVFNLPHNIANYLTKRLHLFPEDINKKIQMARMPENTQQMINQTFGEPSRPGEAAARGLGRNIINIPAGLGVMNAVNPLRYRYKSIARKIGNASEEIPRIYGKKYEKIFGESDKQGLGKNNIIPQTEIDTALMNEPAHAKLTSQEFITNPSTRTAHDFKSDLLKIQRTLKKQNARETLTGGQAQKFDAVNRVIGRLERNMFKNPQGIENIPMLKKYQKTQKGYGQEVIPYTKNMNIKKYKEGKLNPNELVPKLSKGDFIAQRGYVHPEIGRRMFLNALSPYIATGSLGLYTINQLLKLFSQNTENK